MSITKEAIEAILAQYDNRDKGAFRMLVDESHIRPFREFVGLLKSRPLAPADLVKLAIIVKGKNDRDSDAASSKAFRALATLLGGYEAIDRLASCNILKEKHLEFIIKYAPIAKLLAEHLGQMSEKLTDDLLSAYIDVLEKRAEPNSLSMLLSICATEDRLEEFIPLLSTLNQHGLHTDKLIFLLHYISTFTSTEVLAFHETVKILIALNSGMINECDIQLIAATSEIHLLGKANSGPLIEALFRLSSRNLTLITVDNIKRIISSNRVALLGSIANYVPPTQANLDTILAGSTQNPYTSLICLLINFNAASRDVTPFLGEILNISTNDTAYFSELNDAMIILRDVQLDATDFSTVINLLLKYRKDSPAIARAVRYSVKEGGLLIDDLVTIGCFPQHADQILNAHRNIMIYGQLPADWFDILHESPEFAIGTSQFLIQWHRLYSLRKEPDAAVLSNRQYAGAIAQVLEYLQNEGLAKDDCVPALCATKLEDDTLFKFLQILKGADLLTSHNIKNLIERIDHLQTLYTASQYLLNGNVLEQTQLISLLIGADNNPATLLDFAIGLGGKEPEIVNTEPESPAVVEPEPDVSQLTAAPTRYAASLRIFPSCSTSSSSPLSLALEDDEDPDQSYQF